MKIRFVCLLISFLFATCVENNVGVDTQSPAKPIKLCSVLIPKIEQDNTFAFDLFKQLYYADEPGNIFISPLSVSMALSMTLNGAKGETFDEMENALRVSNFSIDDINKYCQTLREALIKADPLSELFIANSIWYRQGFPVEDNFLNINSEYFGSEVNEVNFADPETLDRINKWSSDNTNKKIPSILEKMPKYMAMCLINAVYFKGSWKSKFKKDQTFDGTFYNESGIKSLVKMMSQTGQFEYTVDEITR